MRSKFKIEIRAELRDPRGALIKRYPWKKANSLLKQFIQILTVQLQQSALTVTQTSGTDQSIGAHAYNFKAVGAAADTFNGILIGTGTTAVTIINYKLETQVSTNITHGVVTFTVEAPNANTARVAISRNFVNATGATVGIREVALYVQAGASLWQFCAERTLYSVDVPNGLTVTLTYRISITL